LQNKIIGRRDFKAGLITPMIVRTDPMTSGDSVAWCRRWSSRPA